MHASDLIERLKELIEEHKDLPVTVVFGNTEFSLRGPSHTEEGPCCNIADTQNQSPPERFVFELEGDIPKMA